MSSKTEFGNYTHAIVRQVPDSFVNAIGAKSPIDLKQARLEHQSYIEALKSLGLKVIEVPSDERFPDCPFVEDTAIVINGRALITRPKEPSRANETELIEKVLRNDLKLDIVEIDNDEARIEGGDVLFTGSEIFVGLSGRTNYDGVKALAKTFPEYPVKPIIVPNGILHVKSLVSVAGPKIIAGGSSPEAEKLMKRIELEADSNYKFIKLPDDEAGNCIYANNSLIYKGDFPNSRKIIEQEISYPKKGIIVPNMSKPQADLTCMSILINKID